MQVPALGHPPIPIFRVILGCGTFGGIGGARELIGKGIDRVGAMAVLDEAVALGVNVLDTAERYADGESECTLGQWLRDRPPEVTAAVHVATKVAPPALDGRPGVPFDRDYITRKMAVSLDRLGLERVTFYLSHAPDETTPIEATLEGFAAVVDAGQAQHIGCCNVDARQLLAALEAVDRLGLPPFEWVQNSFSLLTPGADTEVRAICRERGLGYTPFSPLAGGVLTGKYLRGAPIPEGTRLALRPEGFNELLTERFHDTLDGLRATADARGVSCGAVALAWILAHPDVTAPVVGPSRTLPHLAHVGEALRLVLDDLELQRLSALFAEG
jgi:aryl-alcohol dehydrogenase-like predicted oxidoreductase